MTLPAYLRSQGQTVLLAVKLQPRASRNEVGSAQANELKVRVTAPPVDAAANEALLRLLADTLDCPRGAVELVRGHTSRHKLVAIQGLTAEQVHARLITGE
jgi:hypothetical protein